MKVMDWKEIPTPCYVVDEKKMRENLEILRQVEKESGCQILLAQKAFSLYALYPFIGRYISGTTASGLFEARLGKEEMGKENHVYAPAYKDGDMEELLEICDHVVFNSLSQYERHRPVIERKKEEGCRVSVGLRINPEWSTQTEMPMYDPCAPGSRLGIPYGEFVKGLIKYAQRENACRFPESDGPNNKDCEKGTIGPEATLPPLPAGVEGLHIHTLCEQNADDLVSTFHAFEEKFHPWFSGLKWLNLGGGHHISRADYDRDALIDLVRYIRRTYDVEVYLEPGEAIALDAGYLVTEVCDIVHNDTDILILDTSATCHMPDVLETPYLPPLTGSYPAGEKAYTYRLSSLTCLAGDVIGDYSFDHPIQVGDRLRFEDMAIYTMVKNNTFNGIPLPGIALLREDGNIEMIKEFGYEDFKQRLS